MDKYEALMSRLHALAYIANIQGDQRKTCASNSGVAEICTEAYQAIDELRERVKCLTQDYPELENSYF